MTCSRFSNLKPGLMYYFWGNYFTRFYPVKLAQKFNLYRCKIKILFFMSKIIKSFQQQKK